MPAMRDKAAVLLLASAMLAASGCASIPDSLAARMPEPGQPFPLAAGEAVIFGRILLIENSRAKSPYGAGKPMWRISCKAGLRSSSSTLLTTRPDGSFVYAIPAGECEIDTVVPFYYTPMIQPAVRFAARTPGKAHYLGDLIVDYEATTWLGGLWGNYIERLHWVGVEDHMPGADAMRYGSFSQVPAATLPAIRALFESIPGRQPLLPRDSHMPGVSPGSGSIHFGK